VWGAGVLVAVLAGWLLVAVEGPGAADDSLVADTTGGRLAERIALAEAKGGHLNEFILIDGGRFLMGSADGVGESAEHPERWVELSPFYIQRYEVTNEEYRLFDPGHEFPAGKERHPVVSVNWSEAKDYATWLDGALPTEAQWEFAARGEEGRKYPWGSGHPRTGIHGNFGGIGGDTQPAGQYPEGATPSGVHDMAGNVWEWCSDWYGPYPAGDEKDPAGPDAGPRRVLRGGAFGFDEWYVRAASRSAPYPDYRVYSFGFRVALSPFSP
tara:strand:- start:3996 stop:4802 length:807 start_codon:yes stop_codon:yes gene_type:complete